MPTLNYSNAVINLSRADDELWRSINARTEVRMAQKNDVVIELLSDRGRFFEKAQILLIESLAKVAVPYSPVFDEILMNKNNYFFAALKNGELISYIVVSEQENFSRAGKTAYLQLSATDDAHKKICPNYLLIWHAIKFLKESGYSYFNLGLLTYDRCPDPDLESVAFFKRKWAIQEFSQSENVGILRYCYLRFFKRLSFVKRIIFLFHKLTN